jgi:hypothetical protein
LTSCLPRASGCGREVVQQQMLASVFVAGRKIIFCIRDFITVRLWWDFLQTAHKHHKNIMLIMVSNHCAEHDRLNERFISLLLYSYKVIFFAQRDVD